MWGIKESKKKRERKIDNNRSRDWSAEASASILHFFELKTKFVLEI